MPSPERTLYLTFDDGPVEGPTEFVLDVLAHVSAKATFFCIGDNITKYKPIFRSICEAGHAVGNHTFNHLNGWKTKTETYISNINAFDPVAAGAGLPEPTRLFRPPYGRISPRQIRRLKDYNIIMWDVLSQDYRSSLSGENCLRRTISACRPGSIVVFHDSLKARRNLEYALPRLLDHFGGLGYRFEAL